MKHIFIQIMPDSKITKDIMIKHISELQIFIDALRVLTRKDIITNIKTILEQYWHYCLDNKAQADTVSAYIESIKSINIPK